MGNFGETQSPRRDQFERRVTKADGIPLTLAPNPSPTLASEE